MMFFSSSSFFSFPFCVSFCSNISPYLIFISFHFFISPRFTPQQRWLHLSQRPTRGPDTAMLVPIRMATPTAATPTMVATLAVTIHMPPPPSSTYVLFVYLRICACAAFLTASIVLCEEGRRLQAQAFPSSHLLPLFFSFHSATFFLLVPLLLSCSK